MKAIISLISPASPHYTVRKTEFLISINIDPNNLFPLWKKTTAYLSDSTEDYWILNTVKYWLT